MLLSLFSQFCFNCKKENPKVVMKNTGTMVTVTQDCTNCTQGFIWRSQPFTLGRHPAGNVMLSFAILMAGASISKVLLVLRHMGLAVHSARQYHVHQRRFLLPSVFHYWKSYRKALLDKVRGMKEAVWSGDGRFDSMGHSAKYGVYSMLCTSISKIVHFELVQVCLVYIIS